MPQLRKDPIIGRWVIIATERAGRPNDYKLIKEKQRPWPGPCPFCEHNEQHTPPEIFAIRKPNSKPNKPGWNVRVVPSIAPMLEKEGELDRQGVGMYDVINGVGAHEIIVETPEHTSNFAELPIGQVESIIKTYIARITELQKDERLKYVLLFKNYGWIAGGGRIEHARSQLMAMPVNPKRVKEELNGARQYYDYKERCIFCDIIKQELKSGERLITEQDGFAILAPFASRFPFEMWILPTKHSCDFHKMEEAQTKQLAKVLKLALLKLSRLIKDVPYNFVLHTAPFRTKAKTGYWTTIERDYHWHIEIIPRLTRVAGFEWGTGFYINSTSPEDAAKFLREIKP